MGSPDPIDTSYTSTPKRHSGGVRGAWSRVTESASQIFEPTRTAGTSPTPNTTSPFVGHQGDTLSTSDRRMGFDQTTPAATAQVEMENEHTTQEGASPTPVTVAPASLATPAYQTRAGRFVKKPSWMKMYQPK